MENYKRSKIKMMIRINVRKNYVVCENYVFIIIKFSIIV